MRGSGKAFVFDEGQNEVSTNVIQKYFKEETKEVIKTHQLLEGNNLLMNITNKNVNHPLHKNQVG